MSKLKTTLSIFIILFQMSTIFAQEWQFDLNEAQEKAKNENKIIVLVFSGSDWCAPCIKLEKEIWNSEEFKAYAQDNFVMVRADFPRKKENKLTPEQQQKNNQLAEKYNPQGYFPLVVVMDKDLAVLGRTGYKKLTPTGYIEHLNSFIK